MGKKQTQFRDTDNFNYNEDKKAFLEMYKVNYTVLGVDQNSDIISFKKDIEKFSNELVQTTTVP